MAAPEPLAAGRTLSHDEARVFYDRLGSLQDWQWWFEAPGRDAMVRHLELERATFVFELGCGTGRFAKELLESRLSLDARYVAVDQSDTMLHLAHEHLARFGRRVEVRRSSGEMRFDLADGSIDRFVSTYVLDLLSVDDIREALAEAHRLLASGGLLGLVSLGHGATRLARWVERGWLALHRRNPAAVGGCRPLELAEHLPEGLWRTRYHDRVTRLGVTSEVLVAERAGG